MVVVFDLRLGVFIVLCKFFARDFTFNMIFKLFQTTRSLLHGMCRDMPSPTFRYPCLLFLPLTTHKEHLKCGHYSRIMNFIDLHRTEIYCPPEFLVDRSVVPPEALL